jgi:hypothetical protein
MSRLFAALFAVFAFAGLAHAQVTLTPSTYVVASGGSVVVTVAGTPGQQFAVIGSTNNFGFSYAGVNLQVGADVQILATGVLDGAGNGTATVVPPFPARDRYYIQAAMSPSPAFSPLTASNSVTLINNQIARLLMPIGALVGANGNIIFGTQGITVSKSGAVYTIDHAGFFTAPAALPDITPSGGATILSLATNGNQTVVTLSAEAGFIFKMQQIRR